MKQASIHFFGQQPCFGNFWKFPDTKSLTTDLDSTPQSQALKFLPSSSDSLVFPLSFLLFPFSSSSSFAFPFCSSPPESVFWLLCDLRVGNSSSFLPPLLEPDAVGAESFFFGESFENSFLSSELLKNEKNELLNAIHHTPF